MLNKKILFVIVLAVSLFFRLWLTDKGWHVDMWSNAGWGEWIFEHTKAGFYQNKIWTYSWPTQPPLINSVYAFNKKLFIEILGRSAGIEFQVCKVYKDKGECQIPWLSNWVKWFGYSNINLEIPFQQGYLITMKLLPILADILIASIIFYLSGRNWKWPTFFLFSPFSWAVSAVWGQYDGVGFGLALLGFLSIFGPLSILGPGLMTLAVLIKPTSLILVPFFIYSYIRKGKYSNLVKLLNCLIVPLLIFWITTQPYTHKNPLEFAKYDLKRIVFEKTEPRLSVNSFNIWRIFIGNAGYRDNFRWLSLLIFGGLNLAGIYHWEKRNHSKSAMWESLFLISMGSWLLMTGMLERYAYAGIVFGLLATMGKPRLVKYWLGMSLLFWVNLYYHWWWPTWLEPLKQLLTWNQDFVTRIFSAAWVILFAKWLLGNFRKLPDHQARLQKKEV